MLFERLFKLTEADFQTQQEFCLIGYILVSGHSISFVWSPWTLALGDFGQEGCR